MPVAKSRAKTDAGFGAEICIARASRPENIGLKSAGRQANCFMAGLP